MVIAPGNKTTAHDLRKSNFHATLPSVRFRLWHPSVEAKSHPTRQIDLIRHPKTTLWSIWQVRETLRPYLRHSNHPWIIPRRVILIIISLERSQSFLFPFFSLNFVKIYEFCVSNIRSILDTKSDCSDEKFFLTCHSFFSLWEATFSTHLDLARCEIRVTRRLFSFPLFFAFVPENATLAGKLLSITYAVTRCVESQRCFSETEWRFWCTRAKWRAELLLNDRSSKRGFKYRSTEIRSKKKKRTAYPRIPRISGNVIFAYKKPQFCGVELHFCTDVSFFYFQFVCATHARD